MKTSPTTQIVVGSVIVLTGVSKKGTDLITGFGTRWLVREVDHSVLGMNLGYLVCPASYRDTIHLAPEYDTQASIFQRDGVATWVRKKNDENFEIVEVAE